MPPQFPSTSLPQSLVSWAPGVDRRAQFAPATTPPPEACGRVEEECGACSISRSPATQSRVLGVDPTLLTIPSCVTMALVG